MPDQVDIWHGILWSNYKGAVFSHLHELADDGPVDIRFFQVSETRSDRVGTPVDLTYHRYPYRLLFNGDYNRIPKARLFWRVFRETFESRAAMVLLGGYGLPEHWVQAFAARLSGKAVGLFCDSTLRDHKQTLIKSVLKRLFFSLCQVTFCYGERSAELARFYGVPDSRVIYPIAAAALPRDYKADDIVDLRRRSRPSEARLLYVGRLSVEKNLFIALRAFVEVRKFYPSAVFRIVGSGPQDAALRSAAAELRLSESVQFVGSKSGDALFAEYAAATCLVLPSRSEPWGLVVNEALSYGCPAVVTEACGCAPELIVDGETGYVTSSEDLSQMAASLALAVSRFADVEATTRRCLDQIARFTPERAAEKIYDGCKVALSRKI